MFYNVDYATKRMENKMRNSFYSKAIKLIEKEIKNNLNQDFFHVIFLYKIEGTFEISVFFIKNDGSEVERGCEDFNLKVNSWDYDFSKECEVDILKKIEEKTINSIKMFNISYDEYIEERDNEHVDVL